MKNVEEIKVLHLEDDENDVELIKRFLRKEGISCSISVIRTKAHFESVLREGSFDVILSDFTIPGYDGRAALSAARELRPEIPFLFVSGTIGEDRAVEALHAGATDYILKARLDRLGAAVKRALRESSERVLRKQAETERTQLEQRLWQSQKLEAVGQLSAGISHDFNNLLVVIQGYSEMLLLTESGISAEGREALKQVLASSKRATALTRQLLTFSRKQPMTPKVFNLNRSAREMIKMLNRVLESKISVKCNLQDTLPNVYGDQAMLEQVFMNLVLNARDAMPQGGRLTVSTKRCSIGEADLKYPEARTGDFVCLTVQDTGTGIDPKNLPRIFEPFFTTKAQGSGTGLGLATAYGIVRQHEGWMTFESELGKGSLFEVYLPVHTASADSFTAEDAPRGLRGGTEKILVAEDDPAVRQLTARVLEGLGYTVFEADSGVSALELWNHAGVEFDLLLSDILMSDRFTGYELATKLRQTNPKLKVIMTSGYGGNSRGVELPRDCAAFLQKPYSSRELADAVRSCLDAS